MPPPADRRRLGPRNLRRRGGSQSGTWKMLAANSLPSPWHTAQDSAQTVGLVMTELTRAWVNVALPSWQPVHAAVEGVRTALTCGTGVPATFTTVAALVSGTGSNCVPSS